MSPTLVRRMRRAGLSLLAASTLTSSALTASTATATTPAGTDPVSVRHACAPPIHAGQATCLALVRTDVAAHRGVQALGSPPGLGAIDLQHAYRLPASSEGKGRTIAVVDVGDSPKAEADMAIYRAQFGLPPCTTANGCFRKVNEHGGSELPKPDIGWAEEEALDLDMVSAACPNCHILLVESSEPTLAGLGTGVNTAVRLGAGYVSNSYGGAEDASTPGYDRDYFDHPGVAITAASGDSGYGVLFPSTSAHVTAVGGTSLTRAANARGWNETAWTGGGSGCSAFAVKPPWQQDTGCPRRTVADVSAVADPRTGVAVYDTYGAGGWLVVGGTSASAPIIAGAYALAGPPAPGRVSPALPYAHTIALNDIVSGSNGTCRPAYLCTAGPGYDGPTGFGTPNGVTAFRATTPPLARTGERHHGPKPNERRAETSRAPTNPTVTKPAVTNPAPKVRPVSARAYPAPGTYEGGQVANGGFENGTLAGWSAAGVVTGVTTGGPHQGRYAALLGDMDDPKKGDSSIRQSFLTGTRQRSLSFWYNVSCPDKVRYDWATAQLRDDTTGGTTTVLPKTCTYDNTWQRATAPITGGHAYTLTLMNHDDGYYGDPTATKYDDVAVS